MYEIVSVLAVLAVVLALAGLPLVIQGLLNDPCKCGSRLRVTIPAGTTRKEVEGSEILSAHYVQSCAGCGKFILDYDAPLSFNPWEPYTNPGFIPGPLM